MFFGKYKWFCFVWVFLSFIWERFLLWLKCMFIFFCLDKIEIIFLLCVCVYTYACVYMWVYVCVRSRTCGGRWGGLFLSVLRGFYLVLCFTFFGFFFYWRIVFGYLLEIICGKVFFFIKCFILFWIVILFFKFKKKREG